MDRSIISGIVLIVIILCCCAIIGWCLFVQCGNKGGSGTGGVDEYETYGRTFVEMR